MNEIAVTHESETGVDVYDVEERLQMAETRYGRARSCLARVRAEYATLASTKTTTPGALATARERLEFATARCERARREIEEMEKQLD